MLRRSVYQGGKCYLASREGAGEALTSETSSAQTNPGLALRILMQKLLVVITPGDNTVSMTQLAASPMMRLFMQQLRLNGHLLLDSLPLEALVTAAINVLMCTMLLHRV